MHARRWLVRSLWLLVAFALGVSFVGRALAMRAGVASAMVQAAGTASGRGGHGMPMGAGASHDRAPCPRHDGQCCAPCLACCAACASVPVPADARAAGAPVAVTPVGAAAARQVAAPRSPERHLRPPQLGPPSPLVS